MFLWIIIFQGKFLNKLMLDKLVLLSRLVLELKGQWLEFLVFLWA